jgi:hypothetical protein
MSDQWGDPYHADGDFTVPAACWLPAFSSPLAVSTKEYVFTQEWMQSRKTVSATTIGTGHPSSGLTPDYSAFKLISEGPKNDIGGGLVKWQRTYAKAPDSHDEFESYSYSFIGFVGTISRSGGVIATGRARNAAVVTSRVRHDYFLVGAGQTYANAGVIPIVRAQGYYAGASPGPAEAIVTDYICDAFTNTDTGQAVPATVPSRSTYNAWVSAALAYGFDPGAVSVLGANPGQIVAEDSRITRWMGPIFLRQTRYVLAQ